MTNKVPKSRTPVLATKHKDKRANIPTEELRDFVAEEEKVPKTILYPRDPSLDPQLVWQGKDEQDASPLEVPAVPIYIQKKIHPQVIIENLRASSPSPGREGRDEGEQLGLFASDFNGIKFEQLIEFYQHKDGVKWANRMILGDSLLVMNSLAEKEGLKGRVQMIYLDPPYGIKFGSNWQVSTRKRDVKDGKAEDATRQPEQIRAFRDTWKLGIHSYLAYLRDRLTVARELLTESGSVFVQIGDENVHLVRNLLDEVFGSENYVSLIAFKKPGQRSSDTLPMMTDFILWDAKDKEAIKFRPLLVPKALSGDGGDHYNSVELSDGKVRPLTNEERFNPSLLPAGAKVFETTSATSAGAQSGDGKLEFGGKTHYPPAHKHWSASVTGMKTLAMAGRLVPSGNTVRYKRYFDDFGFMYRDNRWDDAGLFGENIYVVQTSTTAVQWCVLMTTDPGDLLLDPTCGSGTTAVVAEQWGRRWITCDTSRVAIALSRTRLMAAKFPFYLLADSPDGLKKESELAGKLPPGIKTGGDIKRGFIYKRVPHVTLKSIANNPDIKPSMSRAEIDAAIARHADTELLYDQPYEDNKRIRVTGPFTVESLSPHRFLSADENGDGTVSEQEARQHHDFTTMILDNLKKAGVQNTRKTERLTFDRLESFAGTGLQATGDYTDKDGKTRRVAVSIGPRHGTVRPDPVD